MKTIKIPTWLSGVLFFLFWTLITLAFLFSIIIIPEIIELVTIEKIIIFLLVAVLSLVSIFWMRKILFPKSTEEKTRNVCTHPKIPAVSRHCTQCGDLINKFVKQKICTPNDHYKYAVKNFKYCPDCGRSLGNELPSSRM